jgi:hypothetical protein
MSHKQFLVKKVNRGIEIQMGVNFGGQNQTIQTWGVKIK